MMNNLEYLFYFNFPQKKQENDNLEQQAQVLYKSWFIDFEPFKNGKFIDSELGRIPEGWHVITLNEICEIRTNTISTLSHPQNLYQEYSIPAFDNGCTPEIKYGKEILSNKFLLYSNTILFSKLNPRIKRMWFVGNTKNNSVCSTEFIPYNALNEDITPYLYCTISSNWYYELVLSLSNGSTGSHQRFHPLDTLNFRVPYDKHTVEKFSRIIFPIIRTIVNNRHACTALSNMRDSLLPKLMSGELKID